MRLPGRQEHLGLGARRSADELLRGLAARHRVTDADVGKLAWNLGIAVRPRDRIALRVESGPGQQWVAGLGRGVQRALAAAPCVEDPAGFLIFFLRTDKGSSLRLRPEARPPTDFVSVSVPGDIVVAGPSLVPRPDDASRHGLASVRWLTSPTAALPMVPGGLEAALAGRWGLLPRFRQPTLVEARAVIRSAVARAVVATAAERRADQTDALWAALVTELDRVAFERAEAIVRLGFGAISEFGDAWLSEDDVDDLAEEEFLALLRRLGHRRRGGERPISSPALAHLAHSMRREVSANDR